MVDSSLSHSEGRGSEFLHVLREHMFLDWTLIVNFLVEFLMYLFHYQFFLIGNMIIPPKRRLKQQTKQWMVAKNKTIKACDNIVLKTKFRASKFDNPV